MEVSELCSFLEDPTLMFSECGERVDPSPYKSLCIMDMCTCFAANNSRQTCLDMRCGAATQYGRACTAKGIVLPWRTDTFCRKFAFLNSWI